MDPKVKTEIENMVRSYHISRSDLEAELNVRRDAPGEFYVLPLAQFKTEDLEAYLEAAV